MASEATVLIPAGQAMRPEARQTLLTSRLPDQRGSYDRATVRA